jgi:hypothetical protein
MEQWYNLHPVLLHNRNKRKSRKRKKRRRRKRRRRRQRRQRKMSDGLGQGHDTGPQCTGLDYAADFRP